MISDTSPHLLAFIRQSVSASVSGAAWEQLAVDGQFELALAEIEQKLLLQPDDPLLRLWWTQCQLELNRLPITALTAPLDDIAKAVRDKPELHVLCSGTLVKAAVGVIRKNQYRLGFGLLERTLELAQSSLMVSASNVQEVRKAYRAMIIEELKRAPARKEPRSYLELLEKKLSSIDQNIADNSAAGIPAVERAAPASVSAPPKRLSSKSMFIEAAGPPADAAAAGAARNGRSDAAAAGIGTQPTRSKAPLYAAISFLLLGGVSGAIWYFRPGLISGYAGKAAPFSNRSAETPVAIAMSFPAERKMSLPAVDNHEAVGSQGLDSVGKRLAELSVSKRPAQAAVRTSQSMADDPDIDHGALNRKNGRTVPKTGLADDDIVSMADLPPAENAIKEKKLPSVDPGKYANTQVEPVGTSIRKAPVPQQVSGGLSVDPNGRIFGPAKSSPQAEPGRRVPDGKSLDGGPLKSYEVQQFDPPRLYRTMTSTEVLSAPSLVSSALARLEKNTPIHVKAKMGPWLELRSTGGKSGYIYAQDASPTE